MPAAGSRSCGDRARHRRAIRAGDPAPRTAPHDLTVTTPSRDRRAFEHHPERWLLAFGKRRCQSKSLEHRPGSGIQDIALDDPDVSLVTLIDKSFRSGDSIDERGMPVGQGLHVADQASHGEHLEIDLRRIS